MIRWIAIGVAVSLAGCSTTTPTPLAQTTLVTPDRVYSTRYASPTSGSGEIILKRNSFGAHLAGTWVYLDGALVARLMPAERLELYVPAGQHILGVGDRSGPNATTYVTVVADHRAMFDTAASGTGVQLQAAMN